MIGAPGLEFAKDKLHHVEIDGVECLVVVQLELEARSRVLLEQNL